MAFTNKYKIEGEIVTIYLKRRNGDVYETLIDKDKLKLLIDLDISWHTRYSDCTGGYYADATQYNGIIDGKPSYTILHLNKFVMGVKPTREVFVDHINHNTLDNRKCNLRVSLHKENSKNRKGSNSNNTSGYRNVSKMGKWWCVQLQVNGKNTILKKFPLDQLEEAGTYAEEMRNKIYKEFAGNG